MTSGKNICLVGLLLLIIGPVGGFGQMQFSEITREAGIDHHYLSVNEMGGGAAFFDMDNDGDQDLWISGGMQWDKLYENDGTGHFTDISWDAGVPITKNYITTGVITGDLDNDGFEDVLLLTHIGFPNVLLRNNGDKTFSNVTLSSGLGAYEAYNVSAALGDINMDGYLDIYAANYIDRPALIYNATRDTVLGFQHTCHSNKLFINNGDWTFTEKTSQYNADDTGCALATAITDFDGDHDPDIMLSNDFGSWVTPNALLQNQYPDTVLSNVSKITGTDIEIYGMGIAIGDYDNDLDLDYYLTNLGRNVLLQNQGNASFIDLSTEAGVEDTYEKDSLFAVGWGTVFADFDNDADLDLYIVNGHVSAAPFILNGEKNTNHLYENDGNGYFHQVTLPESLQSYQRGRGLASADIDGDGDIDFLVVPVNRQATPDTLQKVQLFRNDLQDTNNWISIALESESYNRYGIGSMLYLEAGGKKYMQEVNGGYGTHASQHSRIIHFGLGSATLIDSLIVVWPGGKKQVHHSLPVNQLLTIQEEGLATSVNTSITSEGVDLACFPNPFSQQIRIDYRVPASGWSELTIFDSMGRTVFRERGKAFPNQHQQLVWRSPHPGTYILRLQTAKHRAYRTIISN